MAKPPAGTTAELLLDWLRRARESQWGHYAAERSLLRGHYVIGIPLVLLTAFAGTSIFATISLQTDTWFKVAVALTSVVAAILSGLQTFLRNADRASNHRSAGGSYGALRRELEQWLASGGALPSAQELTTLRRRLDDLAEHSPAIPPRVWARTERRLEER